MEEHTGIPDPRGGFGSKKSTQAALVRASLTCGGSDKGRPHGLGTASLQRIQAHTRVAVLDAHTASLDPYAMADRVADAVASAIRAEGVERYV
jgi:hypothetical protein